MAPPVLENVKKTLVNNQTASWRSILESSEIELTPIEELPTNRTTLAYRLATKRKISSRHKHVLARGQARTTHMAQSKVLPRMRNCWQVQGQV